MFSLIAKKNPSRLEMVERLNDELYNTVLYTHSTHTLNHRLSTHTVGAHKLCKQQSQVWLIMLPNRWKAVKRTVILAFADDINKGSRGLYHKAG